ncbi:hypothetical protein BH09ACT12_BH09ACT12_04890 [soil metagenome]
MRVAVVAMAAVLVGLFTGAPSGEKAASVVRASLNGQPVRLTLPTGSGEPKGLVIWFHGQGGGVNDRVDGPFLRALTRDGYAIASSSFHYQSWGNAESTDDTVRLAAWAEDEVGLPVSVWVSGSMGGAISLNALLHGVTAPPCWYGVKPAISLDRMDAVPTSTKFIAIAYDGVVPADRNPVENVAALPADVRYRVVASPDDTWVPIDENGGALISQLDARGVDATSLAASGPHEDASHWDSGDLVEFANSCDGAPASSESASD